jgi:bacillithiol biosynthesis deacetylase BshB2
VLPHPDDECFGLSGTLSALIQDGAQVTYACLTLGEMGRNMGNPPFASRVSLPAIRLNELQESCRTIGIQDLRTLGFHDKMIEFEDQELLDRKIGDLIAEVRPSVIFTFYPGYAVHPDHDACGEAVVRVVGRLPEDQRPPVRCMAFSAGHEEVLGAPDVVNDVRPFLKHKFSSIAAHRSQFRLDVIFGDKTEKDPEVQDRLGKERFWTYKF